jgi:hypothetical protein
MAGRDRLCCDFSSAGIDNVVVEAILETEKSEDS